MSAVLRHAAPAGYATRLGRTWLLPLLGALLLLAVIFAAATGAFMIAPRQVVAVLASGLGVDIGIPFTEQQQAVLFSIRLPRVTMAVLTGAGLAATGAAMQGLFRNPLADPGLIGVSSGAALAAATVIVLGPRLLPELSRTLGLFALPLAAFLGGLAVAVAIYSVSSREGRISLPVMLLAGIAANALTIAGIGLLSYIATDDQARTLTFWTLGSLGGSNWNTVAICGPCVCIVVALACRHAQPLNAILLGEAEAGHLGVNVVWLKTGVIALTTLCVGALVAFTGVISFMGLVAPHVLRLACGPDNRMVIPGAALFGALLTVVADLVARTMVAPAELPIGILTTLIGAPFFLALLLRQRRAWSA